MEVRQIDIPFGNLLQSYWKWVLDALRVWSLDCVSSCNVMLKNMGIFGNGNVTWDRYRSVMICMGHIFIVKYAHPCVYIYKYRYDIYIYILYIIIYYAKDCLSFGIANLAPNVIWRPALARASALSRPHWSQRQIASAMTITGYFQWSLMLSHKPTRTENVQEPMWWNTSSTIIYWKIWQLWWENWNIIGI